MMVTALWTSIYTVFANIRGIKFALFQLSAVLLHAIGGLEPTIMEEMFETNLPPPWHSINDCHAGKLGIGGYKVKITREETLYRWPYR